MRLKDVNASIRRHWPIALGILLAIPVICGIYLLTRDVRQPPATYFTSADLLISSRDEKGEPTDGAPPVLLQGQIELALSPHTKAVTLIASGLNPDRPPPVSFAAKLSEDGSIMTLSVAASTPELAAGVLANYVTAFEDGRRQSVLDSYVHTADVEQRVVGVLTRKLTEINAQIVAAGGPLLPPVTDGSPLPVAEGMADATVLLLYNRNSLLNERERRQIDYGVQRTNAAIPSDFSLVVETRSAKRLSPPPPSPAAPLLRILGVGLLLAALVPVLLDRFGRTITDVRGASSALHARVLMLVPAIPRRWHHRFVPRGTSVDHAFRTLAATSISTDSLPPAIMVTSPTGITQDVVAANFANALADLGMTVALIGTVPRQKWYAAGPSNGTADDDAFDDEDDGEMSDIEDSQPEPGTDQEGAEPSSGLDTVGGTEPAVAVPTFKTLLEDAHRGLLPVDVRASLATYNLSNFHVIPPGNGNGNGHANGTTSTNGNGHGNGSGRRALDGLPPLLAALARGGVDIVVIAGPALLEDADATIMAWSTRHVLWAIELGHVEKRDAQLAAERMELAGVAPFGITVVDRHA